MNLYVDLKKEAEVERGILLPVRIHVSVAKYLTAGGLRGS